MIRMLSRSRAGPIGLDIGTRSIKLIQLSEDHARLLDASCCDLPAEIDAGDNFPCDPLLVDAIRKACDERNFLGREAVVCLTNQNFFLQRLHTSPGNGSSLDPQCGGDVESPGGGNSASSNGNGKRATVLETQNSAIDRVLKAVELAGLLPRATDVEPAALARSYANQYHRHTDPLPRSLLVQIGYARTIVAIAEGDHLLYVKYVEIGGRDFDRSVADYLGISPADASAMRRNGECSSKPADVNQPVVAAMRRPLQVLLGEVTLCLKLCDPSLLGQPLARTVLSGGEATPRIAEELELHLGIRAEISDPLRKFPSELDVGRRGQWDVAFGLALLRPGR